MGSSVFHGAFSTFLAIIVLAPSKSYIFNVFFKMWFGIILFGVANGFILLPVLLSLCGPLNENKKSEPAADQQNNDIELKKVEEPPMSQEVEGGSNVANAENVPVTERSLMH